MKQQQIQRKLTSLTLMTIMVAGGMTFAVPGMVPEAYAANANLFVSAENSKFDNYMSGPQVIEVTIIDSSISDTNEGEGEPDVTVNGNNLRMVQATDGNWYGYFADKEMAELADGTDNGLDFGTSGSASDIDLTEFEADGLFYNNGDNVNVVREEKNINSFGSGQIGVDANAWPFIQLYTFSQGGNVVVQYNKGGGAQSTTLTFDTVDDFAGIMLDRTSYPQGAQVHATITDAWLNIDPTDEDVWTFNSDPEGDGEAYYHLFDDNGGEGTNTARDSIDPSDPDLMCSDCKLLLNKGTQGNDIIEIQDNSDSNPVDGVPAAITVTEQGPNSGIFGTYDESDKSVLKIIDDADRGTSATVDYNDGPASVLVTHAFATIDIQPASATWNSGELIPVVLVDADINKNTRADEDISLSDPSYKIIPSLRTGSPITLGSGANSDGQITVSYDGTEDNKTNVNAFSDRAILDDAKSGNTVSTVLIDLGITGEELQASLVNTNDGNYGYNLFNYDISSLPEGTVNISLVNTDNGTSVDVALHCNTSGSGLVLLNGTNPSSCKELSDNAAPVISSVSGVANATVGQSLRLTVNAVDTTGNIMKYSANNTETTSPNNDDVFVFTPKTAGSVAIEFTATDEYEATSDTHTVVITVKPAPEPQVQPTPIPLLYDGRDYESQHFGTAFDKAVTDVVTDNDYAPKRITLGTTAIQDVLNTGAKGAVGTYTSEQLRTLNNTGKIGTDNGDIVLLSYSSAAKSFAVQDDGIFRLTVDSSRQVTDIVTKLIPDNDYDQIISIHLDDAWSHDYVTALTGVYGNEHRVIPYDADAKNISTEFDSVLKATSNGLLQNPLDSRTAIVILEYNQEGLDKLIEKLAMKNTDGTYVFEGIETTKFIIPDVPSGAFGTTINDDAIALLKATNMQTIKFALSDNTDDQTALKTSLQNQSPSDRVNLDSFGNIFDRHAYAAYDAGQILTQAIDDLRSEDGELDYTSEQLNKRIPIVANDYSPNALIYNTKLNADGDLACMVYDIFEIDDSSGTFALKTPTQETTNAVECPKTIAEPNAPTGLIAQGRDAAVALEWKAPSTGTPATGYTVQQSTDGTNFVDSTTVTGTTAMVTGLTNGQTYHFRVLATNAQGAGPASNVDTAIPSATATIPEQVTGLNATVGDTQVTLEWNQPHDGNSQILNYTVQYSADAGNTFTPVTVTGTTATITGLTNDQNYIFKVSATNAEGTGPASINVPATPTAPANADPVISSVTGARTVTVGQSLTLTVVATDADTSDTLIYTEDNAETLPTNTANVFTFTPTAQGSVNILFTVSDGNGGSDTETVTITVNAAQTNGGSSNTAPDLDPIGDKFVNVDETLTFTVNATDADGDSITYNMTPRLTGVTFDNRTGEFTWTPSSSGTHRVTFTAADASGMDSETITITVNRPPVLAEIGDITHQEGTALSFTLSAPDPDGDRVNYNVIGKPTGSTLVGHTFTWNTPTESVTNNVMFTASDGKGGFDRESITITITAPAPTPVVIPDRVAFDAGDVNIPMLYLNIADNYEQQFFEAFGIAIGDYHNEDRRQQNTTIYDVRYNITAGTTADIDPIVRDEHIGVVGTYSSEQLTKYKDESRIVFLSYASTASTLSLDDNIFRLTMDNKRQTAEVLKPQLDNATIANVITIHRDDAWSADFKDQLVTLYGNNHKEIAYNSSATDLTGEIMSKLTPANVGTIAANTAIVILGFGEVETVIMELSKTHTNGTYIYTGIETTNIFIPDLAATVPAALDADGIALLKATDMKTIKFALDSANAKKLHDIANQGNEYADRHVYAAYDAGQIMARAIDQLGKDGTAEQLKQILPDVARAYNASSLTHSTILGANGDLECTIYDVLEIADDATATSFTYKAADPVNTCASTSSIPMLNSPQLVSCIDCAINSFGEIFGQTVQVDQTDKAHTHNATITNILDIHDDSELAILIEYHKDNVKTNAKTDAKADPIVLDFFAFGFGDDGRTANQIVRLELEETGDNTDTFVGGLEYTMLNQLNILDADTYKGLSPISDEPTFIVMEDLTDEDSPRVNYLDLGADGVSTQIADQQAAPSHSGVVSLDSKSYKVADTVIVKLTDADLNVDSDLIDIFTVVEDGDLADTVGKDVSKSYSKSIGANKTISESGNPLGRILDVTFDDETWTVNECGDDPNSDDGLHETGFTLIETETASGVFTGSFQIPAMYCPTEINGENNDDGKRLSVTGTDIEVNYLDYRDESGEIIEVGDSAGVRASTGSISLDRTVYPVPFADNAFPLHPSIDTSDGSKFKDEGASGYLPQGDAIIHVRVSDPDYDLSASGEDTIASGTKGPIEVTVSRGQASKIVATAGGENVIEATNTTAKEYGPITEIAPDAGIFEADIPISYNDGPTNDCPVYPNAANNIFKDGCILQGDIITVQYEDPTDASGEPNTITDSATFDLRNAVLQSGKSVYIIGSDMILTLIEPDFDLDNDGAETYPLDLIEWDSDAGTTSMGKYGTDAAAFDPEPADFRETGDSTGVFQVVVEVPAELGGDKLERGEEIELEYTDWGPSGSDHVGDEDEDINLTIFTSNFGSTVELDQKVYTWTDKVYITIVAPDHNFDSDLVDEIGNTGDDPIKIATRGDDLDQYKLVETGPNTGIFTGEVILTGFAHDANGDGEKDDARAITGDGKGQTDNLGPTNGFLATEDDDGLSISFEFSEDETVVGSALIRWNIGEVQWLEASYAASGTGVIRVIDPDMNLNPESVDNFEVNVWSDSDVGGIDLTVTETNQATGIFEGTAFFTVSDTSSGHRLRVSEGDTVTAEYNDRTLPDPHDTSDEIDITATTQIGSIIPPLERAPATNLRVVDAFSNTLDTVDVDQQVQITADLANGQDKDQPFAYIVQIQDSSSVTVALAWVSGTLTPSQSFSPALSWTPSEAGTYTATAFVWESVDNPTALSPPNELTITVN